MARDPMWAMKDAFEQSYRPPQDNFGCSMLLLVIFVVGTIVKYIMGW
jgi:hypothetical protein